MRDIEKVRRCYGCKAIYFYDDNFSLNPRNGWLNNFCREFKKLGIPAQCVVHLNTIDEEIVSLFANSNIRAICTSIESINESTRKFLERPSISNEQIEKRLALFKKYGIKVRVSFLIGIPVSDPVVDAIDNVLYSQQHREYWCTASILQPYQSTKLYTFLKEKNLILESTHKEFRDRSIISMDNPHFFSNLVKLWPIIVRSDCDEAWVRSLCQMRITFDDKFVEFMDAQIHAKRMSMIMPSN
jgi:radical SAM superfamily enzyme YgiQ (UPF0313 family)